MATALDTVKDLGGDYKYGFVTDIEAEVTAKGLNEDTVRLISAKKNDPEWLTEWRLQSLERFFQMEEPDWAKVEYPPIDFQDISYFAAPKSLEDAPKSLDEVDPELLRTYEKLGIPVREQEILAGVARRLRLRQRIRRHDVQGKALRTRHHLLLDLGSHSGSP